MSVSTSLLWRGLLALAVGAVAVVWPNITVGAFVILFAVYAFIAAAMDAMRAFSSSRAGPVVGYLLLAVLSAVGGVVALAWPDITGLVLVVWVGVWATISGIVEVALAFRQSATAGDRALWAITGWSPSPWASCCSSAPTSAPLPWPPSSACSASSAAPRH
jgi:uncharacterized membrane protein HdeD (DUF308 family)